MLVDVYLYCQVENDFHFYLFHRSAQQIYAHQWRMIGGKVKEHETAWQAALREFSEETQLSPIRFWTLPSVNTFYEHQTDRLHHIPAFCIEVSNHAVPILNHEHQQFGIFPFEDALNLLQWTEQKRLLALAYQLLRHNAILPEWEIFEQP